MLTRWSGWMRSRVLTLGVTGVLMVPMGVPAVFAAGAESAMLQHFMAADAPQMADAALKMRLEGNATLKGHLDRVPEVAQMLLERADITGAPLEMPAIDINEVLIGRKAADFLQFVAALVDAFGGAPEIAAQQVRFTISDTTAADPAAVREAFRRYVESVARSAAEGMTDAPDAEARFSLSFWQDLEALEKAGLIRFSSGQPDAVESRPSANDASASPAGVFHVLRTQGPKTSGELRDAISDMEQTSTADRDLWALRRIGKKIGVPLVITTTGGVHQLTADAQRVGEQLDALFQREFVDAKMKRPSSAQVDAVAEKVAALLLANEFNAPVGQRGRFEPLFKDGDKERGGWVHRVDEVLNSDLPEAVEKEAGAWVAAGVQSVGVIGMGGESSIIGPTDADLVNVNSTASAKRERLIPSSREALEKMRWVVVSKSGGTREMKENAEYLEAAYNAAGLNPTDYITYFTDPGSALAAEKGAAGFVVRAREINNQTSIGGRNTLANTPTLLALAWRNRNEKAGVVRRMLESVQRAHAFEEGKVDPWVLAAVQATPVLQSGRYKVAVIQPEAMRQAQWVWEQQNPEESLGKDEKGFTVYTTLPDLDTLARMKDEGWVFVELQVPGQEAQTAGYAERAREAGHPVFSIPVGVPEGNPYSAQAASYGWMKFVAAIGGVWGINFSNQPGVEKYKTLMRSGRVGLSDTMENAGAATMEQEGLTLIFDGLLPYLNEQQAAEIATMQQAGAPLAQVYAKLLLYCQLRPQRALDGHTIAFYDDMSPEAEGLLEDLTHDLHIGTGLAAKFGEGTGVLHGLQQNWVEGVEHQIPVQVVADSIVDSAEGGASLNPGDATEQAGAVAAHLSQVQTKRPSAMLIVHGHLDAQGRERLKTFYSAVSAEMARLSLLASLASLGLAINPQTGRMRYLRQDAGMPLQVTSLELVRHGVSRANEQNIVAGPEGDGPERGLSEIGHSQARETAAALFQRHRAQIIAAKSPSDLPAILYSPLVRARETADAFVRLIEQEKGWTAEQLRDAGVLAEEPLLSEFKMGAWDGLVRGAIPEQRPQDINVLQRIDADGAMEAPEGGESFVEGVQRASELVERLNQRYSGRRVIAFSHHYTINAVRTVAGDRGISDESDEILWVSRAPAQGEVVSLVSSHGIPQDTLNRWRTFFENAVRSAPEINARETEFRGADMGASRLSAPPQAVSNEILWKIFTGEDQSPLPDAIQAFVKTASREGLLKDLHVDRWEPMPGGRVKATVTLLTHQGSTQQVEWILQVYPSTDTVHLPGAKGLPRNPAYGQMVNLQVPDSVEYERWTALPNSGTSGDRQEYDASFHAQHVVHYAQTIADLYWDRGYKGPLLVGYDARHVSDRFAKIVAEVLAANGIEVIMVDEQTPTPVMGFLVNHLKTAGYVHLTASHNPPNWLGLKFAPSNGGAASQDVVDWLNARARKVRSFAVGNFNQGIEQKRITLLRQDHGVDPTEAYANWIMEHFPQAAVDIRKRKESDPTWGFAFDAMHGTSTAAAVRLLGPQGVDVLVEGGGLRTDYNPNFGDARAPFGKTGPRPEPAEEYLDVPGGLIPFLKEPGRENVAGGSADNDADRVGIVDQGGRFITPNEFAALLLYFFVHELHEDDAARERGQEPVVFKTVPTSNLLNALAKKLGVRLIEGPVGFKNVVPEWVAEKMFVLVGAEESAHIGALNTPSWDDGIFVTFLGAWMQAKTGKTFTEMLEEVEAFVGQHFDYARDNPDLTDESADALRGDVGAFQAVLGKGVVSGSEALAAIPALANAVFEKALVEAAPGKDDVQQGLRERMASLAAAKQLRRKKLMDAAGEVGAAVGDAKLADRLLAGRVTETVALAQRLGREALGAELAEVITKDGVKFVFDDGSWITIRASGTENVMRLYVESTAEITSQPGAVDYGTARSLSYGEAARKRVILAMMAKVLRGLATEEELNEFRTLPAPVQTGRVSVKLWQAVQAKFSESGDLKQTLASDMGAFRMFLERMAVAEGETLPETPLSNDEISALMLQLGNAGLGSMPILPFTMVDWTQVAAQVDSKILTSNATVSQVGDRFKAQLEAHLTELTQNGDALIEIIVDGGRVPVKFTFNVRKTGNEISIITLLVQPGTKMAGLTPAPNDDFQFIGGTDHAINVKVATLAAGGIGRPLKATASLGLAQELTATMLQDARVAYVELGGGRLQTVNSATQGIRDAELQSDIRGILAQFVLGDISEDEARTRLNLRIGLGPEHLGEADAYLFAIRGPRADLLGERNNDHLDAVNRRIRNYASQCKDPAGFLQRFYENGGSASLDGGATITLKDVVTSNEQELLMYVHGGQSASVLAGLVRRARSSASPAGVFRALRQGPMNDDELVAAIKDANVRKTIQNDRSVLNRIGQQIGIPLIEKADDGRFRLTASAQQVEAALDQLLTDAFDVARKKSPSTEYVDEVAERVAELFRGTGSTIHLVMPADSTAPVSATQMYELAIERAHAAAKRKEDGGADALAMDVNVPPVEDKLAKEVLAQLLTAFSG